MRVLGINNQIPFTRRPLPEEERGLKDACDKAYDAIGVTDRVAITHGSCFPALDRNTYIGSPYGKAAREYVKFLSLYGFNGNQLGPGGELEFKDGEIKPSPYNSSAFAKNRLFIDLEDLTTDKYGKILSKETFNSVTEPIKNTDENYEMSNFEEAIKTYDEALSESFKNFKTNVAKGQPQALALQNEYNSFLSRNNKRLTDEGIFKVLARHYNTDKIDDWHNERDENLISDLNNGDIEAIERYNSIKKANKNEIEQHKFEQFIATKQIKENKEWREKLGFKYFNDLLVGCSQMDMWRYKDAFLKDWEMGAKEYNGRSQRWHIPVIDPKKIFKNDKYELNIGGKFLKEKINFALEFNENIRIDHAMGLIEPYLLLKNASNEDFSNNCNKNNNIEKYISELTDKNGKEYDKYWDYPKLLTKLILPALKEHNIKSDMPVWEDLCTYPPRFREIYENQLNLPKIINLDWTRAQEALKTTRKGDWYLIGSHDNIPAMNYLDREGLNGFKYTKSSPAWDVNYLAGYLNIDDGRQNISDIRNELKNKLNSNDRDLVRAKFAELMTTPKFQISFADILGITDVTYNMGGIDRKENWKERISPDFLDKYYANLASENPTALNIPELLKQALQAKIDEKVSQSENKDQTRAELNEKYSLLLNDLQKYADILKE